MGQGVVGDLRGKQLVIMRKYFFERVCSGLGVFDGAAAFGADAGGVAGEVVVAGWAIPTLISGRYSPT